MHDMAALRERVKKPNPNIAIFEVWPRRVRVLASGLNGCARKYQGMEWRKRMNIKTKKLYINCDIFL